MARIVANRENEEKHVQVLGTDPIPNVALDQIPLKTDGISIVSALDRNPEREIVAPTPKRYRILSHGTKDPGKYANDPNGGGRIYLHEGKEISEQHFDIPALKRQGVRLEEILDEPGAHPDLSAMSDDELVAEIERRSRKAG